MNVDSWVIEAHIFTKVNDELKFLIMKRSETEVYPGVWQMVSGTIDGDEKAYETALREIKEEADLEPDEFYIVPFVNSFYSARWNKVCMIPVFAGYVENPNVKISNEHSEFKWVDMDEALKMLAWEGQRTSVKLINEYFSEKNNILQFSRIK